MTECSDCEWHKGDVLIFCKMMYRGIYYRYPLCCVWAFARDVFEGNYPAKERGIHGSLTCEPLYIPCEKCLPKNKWRAKWVI